MQNVVLVRTLASLVLKESESAKFLDRLLDAITHELNVHSVAVWSLDSRTGLATLEKTAYNGNVLSGVSQLKHPLAGREGIHKSHLFAKVLANGAIQIDDVSRTRLLEPAIRRWLKLQRVKSMLCVPLRVGKKMTGALNIRVAKSGGMLASKTHLVHALADLVSLAIRLNGMLERKQENATMRERSRLASELHDSISQGLTAAVLQMEAAEHSLSSGADKAHSHLSLAESMVRQSHEELRRSVWALRPLSLEGRTLPEALRELAARLSGHEKLSVEFVQHGKSPVFSEEIDSNFLRITQEAVNNAIRHAMASKIKIELAYSARRKTLTISDNGVGFKTAAARAWHGAGLENMRERAARIGAQFSVHSARKRGTRVTVILPIPAA
jgi:signal transduction histidine kinase